MDARFQGLVSRGNVPADRYLAALVGTLVALLIIGAVAALLTC